MEDFNEIKDKFIKVLQYSQGVNNATNFNVNTLFNKWEENKRRFYSAWGNSLIWTDNRIMTFHLDEKQRKFKYTCFIEKVEAYWDNKLLAQYLRQLPANDFFNNLISQNVTLNDVDYKYKGVKLLKAFKYFEKDKNVLFDMQNEASRIIQEDKITGIFCLSVHPLDFLSLSENDHQWRSCHALDGDYRAGNLSYMVDKCTFIAYICSKDVFSHKLPNFPEDVLWNSKKWRRLIFMSDDMNMMFAGRPYPFALDDSLSTITSLCDKFFAGGGNYWGEWHQGGVTVSFNNYVAYQSKDRLYLVGNNILRHEEAMFLEPDEPLHFNDLTSSTVYVPWYSYRTRFFGGPTGNTTRETAFHIGEDVPCPVCGSRYLSQHDVMMCMRCWRDIEEMNNRYHCECCGEVIDDDDITIVEGSVLCHRCVQNETSVCDRCHITYFNDHIHYDRVHNCYLCNDCQDELEDEEDEGEDE